MLQQADIERAAEQESKYIGELRTRYTQKERYRQRLGLAREFLTQRGFDPRSLRIFRRNEDQGIIYLLVTERFRTVHHSLVETILSELKGDESRESENVQEAYGEAYEHAYSRFLNEYALSALLFETCCRRLFEEGIEGWFLTNRCTPAERSSLIRTASARINEILTPLRLNLAKEKEIDVFLLSEVFGKSPLVTPGLSELTLKEIAADVFASGLTPPLFERIARLLQLGIETELEERLLRSWKTKKIRSKSDLRTAERLPIYSISPGVIQKLKHLMDDRVNRQRLELTEKLRNLEQEWSEKKESFEETIVALSHQARKAFNQQERELLKGSTDRLRQVVDCASVELSELEEKKGQLELELKLIRSLSDLTDRELSSLVLREEKRSLERYFHSYGFLRQKYGDTLERLPRRYLEPLPQTVKEELATLRETASPSYERLSNLETKHFWKKEYDVAEVLSRWRNLCSDILEPLVVTKCLEELISLYPPVIRERTLSKTHLEEARFVGEELYFKNRLYSLGGESYGDERGEEERPEELRELIVDNFREVVSVLIYDIRGSTFMGNRLNDARKESDIRGNFNAHMLKVARFHGAFPVKDTGDGGILFFSGNSTGLASRFSQAEGADKFADYQLVPSAASARRALECARDMIQAAFTFVEENLEKYQDWFDDVRKESLRYAGTTYAQLPPEYKRIFKVGIGIASGKPGVDMHFGPNAFGSPDITGGLVREANFYSKARSKERSIILCDSTTLLSFLLSADEFEPEGPEPIRTHSLEKESPRDLLLDTMMNYANLKRRRRGYEFGRLGMYIERVGSQMLTGGEIESSFSLNHLGVEITKTGEFLDERDRKVKVLYQVIPEWMK